MEGQAPWAVVILAGAVSTLFGLVVMLFRDRIASLERDCGKCRDDLRAYQDRAEKALESYRAREAEEARWRAEAPQRRQRP